MVTLDSGPPAMPWGMYGWCHAIIRATLIVLTNLYTIAAYLGWMVLLSPVRLLSADLFWFLESKMYAWLQAIVAHWLWSAGFVVANIGEDVSAYADEECLLLVNHQSTGDVPILMTFLQDKVSVTGRVLWIIDQLFRRTHFGLCSWLRGDYFITTGKKGRDQELVNLKCHMETYMWANNRKWIILFPEGGFLRKRKAVSQAYAKKNDFPILEHCTLPRLGAMQTIMEALSPNFPVQNGCRNISLKWVVDVTIGYPGARPLDAWCILFGDRAPCRTEVHCRMYPANTVPTETTTLRDWLFERYVEKDALLAHFYRTGRFPPPLPASQQYSTTLNAPVPVEYSVSVCVAQHVFFLLSLLVQYWLASYAVCSITALFWG